MDRCDALRLDNNVAFGNQDDFRERSLVLLCEECPLGVERIVTSPVRCVHDRVDDDLRAVRKCARAIAAEDHRKLILGEADPA